MQWLTLTTFGQVYGAYFCAQIAARKFIQLGIKGSIVMTSSMTSYRPNRVRPRCFYTCNLYSTG